MNLLYLTSLTILCMVSIHGEDQQSGDSTCRNQSIREKYAALFNIFPNRANSRSGQFTNILGTITTKDGRTVRRRKKKCGLKCRTPVITTEEQELVRQLKSKIETVPLATKLDAIIASRKKRSLHPRYKRSTQEVNGDGSVTTITSCNERGTVESDGTKMLCKECAAQTQLSEDIYPRYINEVVCDSNDAYCLTYQGACVQNYIYMTFKKDTGGHGLEHLDLWTDYTQVVRNGCHCQLFNPSVFDPFI